ncbi:hypothetical protein BJY00DRAFT_313666 [Aspergillus carlsbadensis]|nr:hypothetical protein BJY00DRAFT_313666 [Aspergillus carlsbadensis]
MGSLVIAAAIIIAAKSPDWIESYKQHKAKKANESDAESTPPPDYFGDSSDAIETTPGKRSKRDLLTRKYWHERRELRQTRDQIEAPERRASVEQRGSGGGKLRAAAPV